MSAFIGLLYIFSGKAKVLENRSNIKGKSVKYHVALVCEIPRKLSSIDADWLDMQIKQIQGRI